jgi:hypothetical protein
MTFGSDHRAIEAFEAISVRSAGERASALAFPPIDWIESSVSISQIYTTHPCLQALFLFILTCLLKSLQCPREVNIKQSPASAITLTGRIPKGVNLYGTESCRFTVTIGSTPERISRQAEA